MDEVVSCCANELVDDTVDGLIPTIPVVDTVFMLSIVLLMTELETDTEEPGLPGA